MSQNWDDDLVTAEELIPIIGRLYRQNGVVLSIHGRSLINRNPIELLKAHRYARHIDGRPLDVSKCSTLVRLLDQLNLGPASIDVARLIAANTGDLEGFVRQELASVIDHSNDAPQDNDVVLYGFGRIGRLVARILIAQAGDHRGLNLRAVVVRRGSDDDLVKRASLLRRDSVHGPFEGTITVDPQNDTIIANGIPIRVIYSDSPATIDYTAYGINNALIIDNTGRWRDEQGLSQHLESKGAAKVLLTAPGKGELPNIVYGINHDEITPEQTIITAASCTTNAIAPVLKVIDDAFGINFGHVETVHSFTNDQNLIDNFHKGERRGRSAVLNMVITETGAASAVARVLPSFAGKLTGNSIRVPTPDVSMAILNLTLDKPVTKLELNQTLRDASLESGLRNQIDYIESPEVVSTDFVGSNRAGIVDGLATISQGNHAVVYIWYDNENGYSHQVLRVAQAVGGVKRALFPR
jgi:glyceraldehyde-3-phosphate dehydrogenase type I